MIKNVVFDIGGVLLDYEPMKLINDLGYKGDEADRLYKLTFGSKLHLEMDRGTYTYNELYQIYIDSNPEYAGDIVKIRDSNWIDKLEIKQETATFMLDLKEKGYNIYLLSNFGEETFNYTWNKHKVLHEPIGKLISYEVNLVKPEPEIYKLLLDKFYLNAEETVFIDDVKINIDGAKEQGIYGILFTDINKVKDEFNKLIYK